MSWREVTTQGYRNVDMTIFASDEDMAIEISWDEAWHPDGTLSAVITLRHFYDWSTGRRTYYLRENFHFDTPGLVEILGNELIKNFTDDIKRTEILNTIRVSSVL